MKAIKNSGKYYPVWLWMFSVTLPSIFYGLVMAEGSRSFYEGSGIFITVAPVAFFASYILSFPVFLLLLYTYRRLIFTDMPVIRIRLISIGITIGTMLMIFILLGNWLGFTSWGDLLLALPYAVCVVAGGFLLKVKKAANRHSYSHLVR